MIKSTSERPLRAILMPTCGKYERYIDGCADAIDALWPGHPDLWVLTDRGDFRYGRSVVVERLEWAALVAGAVDRLVADGHLTRSDRVLLLIEDHTPVAAVPWVDVERVAALSVERDLKFVSLNGDFGTGRTAEIGRAGALGVYEMAPDYLYFSSLHPAIWEVGHLSDMLAHARAAGDVDPWRFEKLRLPGVPHFTTDAVWTSHYGGFLKGGWVDIHVVRAMKHPGLRRLRRELLAVWAGQRPSYWWMRLRRVSARFGLPGLVGDAGHAPPGAWARRSASTSDPSLEVVDRMVDRR